ncbi:hypothetical protein KR038_003966 [Drosophila bunnanda]|nr:hypothetical protein KR038_003966 [Drosophila bunnanda]
MNLLYLLLWLVALLATGNGDIYMDMSTVEVPTDEFNTEHNSRVKMYSTGPDYDEFMLERNAAGDEGDFFLGTTFFQGPRKECFTLDEIALLRARQGFEWLVPKTYPKYLSSTNMAHMLVRYWHIINYIAYRMSDHDTHRLMYDAFYDTLGAYSRYYLMPMAQVSFYAGRIPLGTVESLMSVKQECHNVLKTNGNGWRIPPTLNITDQLKGLNVAPARLGVEATEDGSNICDQLDLGEEAAQGRMLWLLPNLEPVDENGHLTDICLPFRQNLVCSLQSPDAASELKHFLSTMAACQSYMAVSPVHYNHMLLDWMQEFVPQHLGDEQFYPGLDGILQIQQGLLQATQEEVKDEYASSKHERSIGSYPGKDEQVFENLFMNEKVYIAASIVLTIVFLIVACILHCGRISAENKKKKARPSQKPEDVELGELITTRAKSKRAKKDKKTPRSPLKTASNRRYYGHMSKSVSSDDCSTSTLGFQLKHKIMPFRFESPLDSFRSNYKYSPLSSEHEMQEFSGLEMKKTGRGK